MSAKPQINKPSSNLDSAYNLRTIQRDYIARALGEQQRPKYLVLDAFTMDCISVAFFKSELYLFNVFDTLVIKNLDTVSVQGVIDAVFIVRPTKDNIDRLVAHLQQGTPFDGIHICRQLSITIRQPNIYKFSDLILLDLLDFTNQIQNPQLEELAQADQQNRINIDWKNYFLTIVSGMQTRIKNVKEINIDYYVTDPDIYSLRLPFLGDLSGGEEDFKSADKEFLKRAEDSLFSLCLALRRLPNITHSATSRMSHKIADNLCTRLEREYTQNHKDFFAENLELVLFDRREDPITPLIYNWSYMSLVHEFLKIESNTVQTFLDAITILQLGLEMLTVKSGAKAHIFARETGDFFLDQNWLSNYGELTRDLHSHLEGLKRKSGSAKKLQTVADMAHKNDAEGSTVS